MELDVKTVLLCLTIAYVLYCMNRSEDFTGSAPSKKLAAVASPDVSVKENGKSVDADKVRRVAELGNDMKDWEIEQDEATRAANLNPNMMEIQFHPDYQDVITAIKLIVPTYRQLFNLPNRPLTYSEPAASEILPLAKQFVDQVNTLVRDKVKMDVQTVDGWEKLQIDLGRQTLYSKRQERSDLQYVATTNVKKYATDDEIKYDCKLVLQKDGSEDQIVVRVSFVQDNRAINDEDNFFKAGAKPTIHIEQIHIEGYLVPEGKGGFREENRDDDVYDFNDLEVNNMTNPEDIQKELQRHHQQKMQEMLGRNMMLDEEGKVFDFTCFNGIDKTASYLHTQTIFDDMARASASSESLRD